MERNREYFIQRIQKIYQILIRETTLIRYNEEANQEFREEIAKYRKCIETRKYDYHYDYDYYRKVKDDKYYCEEQIGELIDRIEINVKDIQQIKERMNQRYVRLHQCIKRLKELS